MVRALRYPRLSIAASIGTLLCAAARDICVGKGLHGWAAVLLVTTFAMVAISAVLFSCRFYASDEGVGVGFLLRSVHARWEDLSALGVLCCNSRRPYLYGMYRQSGGILTLLHRAPRCGPWGFVVPLSKRLMSSVAQMCPYEVDFSPIPHPARAKGLRPQWHQLALYAVAMIPGCAVAFGTAALMLIRASGHETAWTMTVLTLGALTLIAAGLVLVQRLVMTFATCPGISETGVCAGRMLYLPWEEVRFGYVHRFRHISGLFLLSSRLADTGRRGAPPLICFSMPDTSTLLLAYLTYCPHAPKDAFMR